MDHNKEVLVIYWSKTGNTSRVAHAIRDGIDRAGLSVSFLQVKEAKGADWMDYSLLFICAPSYQWRPPKELDEHIHSKFIEYRDRGYVKLGSPTEPNRRVVLVCTYSGPHTGLNEAIPVNKYLGQFFEHLGFEVLDEWYVLSEFHGSKERSTKGRMGDIQGLPSNKDLQEIREKTYQLIIDLKK